MSGRSVASPRSAAAAILRRYGPVIASLASALALSLVMRRYLYPRPILILALVVSIWGRGLGTSLVGAGLATVSVSLIFPELLPKYGVISDAAMFGLAAVVVTAYSGAKMRAEAQRRLAEEQLRIGTRRFIDAQRLAEVGSWERYFEAGAIYWSDEMFRIFGLAKSAPPDFQPFLNYIHPDDRQTILEADAKARSNSDPTTIEYRIIRPTGEVRFLRSVVEVIDDGKGLPLRIAGARQDITEQARAKAALHESEHRFRAIFSQAAVGIAQVGPNGEWLLLNDRFCEIVGYSQDEIRNKTFLDITHPEDRESALASWRRYHEEHLSSWSTEKRYVRKNGATVWVRLFVSHVAGSDGRPEYLIAVVEDITEKKRAEEALLESERRLALAQGIAPMGIWEFDLQTGTCATSHESFRLYGLPPDHPPLTWEEGLQLVHPEDRVRLERLMRQSIEHTHFWDTEFRVVWPDLSIHWLLGKGRVFLNDEGRPVRVMIWAAGTDKMCTFFSRHWLEFTGRTLEQELGNGWANGVHADDLDRCLATYSSAFDARQSFRMEYRLRRADGEYRWVLDSGAPRFAPGGIFAGYIGSAIDVTDFKRSQEEALARQKLESRGVLSAGIAHDFNNLLGSILAQAELAETGVTLGAHAAEAIRQIKAVAIRASEIVRELLLYSGQDEADLDLVDVSQLVEEMAGLLKISVSRNVALQTDLHRPLPAVRGNAAQVRQVVMNLIINASEAIGARSGVIRINTSQATVGQDLTAKGSATLPEGNYVKLEVADTGCGITDDAKARIFDPFYTTKFAGRGLRLSVVQGIVLAHKGGIDLVTNPGKGTTFCVLLPCAGQPPSPGLTVATVADKQPPGASQTVLLVEDEEALRMSVAKLLRKQGFSVIEAGDGSAAVDLFRSQGDSIHMILLDMTYLVPAAMT